MRAHAPRAPRRETIQATRAPVEQASSGRDPRAAARDPGAAMARAERFGATPRDMGLGAEPSVSGPPPGERVESASLSAPVPAPALDSPVQRTLTYGVTPIKSRADLKRFGIGDDFFNVGQKRWKELLGNRWAKKDARAAHIAAQERDLADLIADRDHHVTATTPDALKQELAQYQQHKLTQAKMVRSAMAASSSAPALDSDEEDVAPATERKERAVDDDEEERIDRSRVPAHARRLFDLLMASGRAFPPINVYRTAKKADESGFLNELELAASALEQLPAAHVQFGALPLRAIKLYLGAELADFQKDPKRNIGADITVWIPASKGVPLGEDVRSDRFGADFIQAKSIKWTSLKKEMKAAANQLSGLNANPNKAHGAKDAEATLQGEHFLGSIFIEVNDGVQDLRELDGLAATTLSSYKAFVHSIVVEDGRTGDKYIYPKRSSQ